MPDYREISSAVERFGLPLPPAVVEATELVEEVDAAVTAEAAKTKPTPAELRPGNAVKLAKAMVDFDAVPARLAALRTLAGVAKSRVNDAWWHAVPAIVEAFRPVYDGRAATFLSALDELGDDLRPESALVGGRADAYTAATRAAGELDVLRNARMQLANAEGWPNLDPRSLVEWSTFAVLDAYGDTLTRRIPARTAGVPKGSPQWWAVVARLDGLTLKWGSKAESVERATAALRRPRKPDPVARESVRVGDAPAATSGPVPGPPPGVLAR